MFCLGEAWERFRVSRLERKKPAVGTICNCSDLRKRLFVDWLDLALTELECPYPGEWRQSDFAFKWGKQSLLPPMDAVEGGEGLGAKGFALALVRMRGCAAGQAGLPDLLRRHGFTAFSVRGLCRSGDSLPAGPSWPLLPWSRPCFDRDRQAG